MKVSIGQLRKIIKEALLKEEACPECGNKGAYVGLHDVECPNKSCSNFSQRQADEEGQEKKEKPQRQLKNLTWDEVEKKDFDVVNQAHELAGSCEVHGRYKNRDATIDDFDVYVDEEGRLNMVPNTHGLSSTAHSIYGQGPSGEGEWLSPEEWEPFDDPENDVDWGS